MAVRGGWRPLSGLICEIVNSVGQGISNTYGCGNHAIAKQLLLLENISITFNNKNVATKMEVTS